MACGCCDVELQTETVNVFASAAPLDAVANMSDTTTSETSGAIRTNSTDRLLRHFRPPAIGISCTQRPPKVGDIVVSTGGKRSGNDHLGVRKAWILMPWNTAEVVEVDKDNDFRLLSSTNNVESGWLVRSQFAYVQDPTKKKFVEAEEATPDTSTDCSVPRKRFEAELPYTTDPSIGIEMDTRDFALVEIVAMSSGRVAEYNNKASEEERIRIGDFIVGVNGKSSKEEFCKELKKRYITLSVFPRVLDKVTFDGSETLGLECSFSQNSKSLYVEQVGEDGAVSKYNASCIESDKIYVGTRICAVNKIKQKPKDMMTELVGVKGKIDLLVLRTS